MVKITETTATKAPWATVYPNEEFLADYKDNDFASFASTLQIEAMVGNAYRRLGDSDVVVYVEETYHAQELGMEEFKEACKVLYEAAKKALPDMADRYKAFYQHFIDDFDANGLVMPMVERIL